MSIRSYLATLGVACLVALASLVAPASAAEDCTTPAEMILTLPSTGATLMFAGDTTHAGLPAHEQVWKHPGDNPLVSVGLFVPNDKGVMCFVVELVVTVDDVHAHFGERLAEFRSPGS